MKSKPGQEKEARDLSKSSDTTNPFTNKKLMKNKATTQRR